MNMKRFIFAATYCCYVSAASAQLNLSDTLSMGKLEYLDSLPEIVVKAEKPLVKVKKGKITYDAQQLIQDKSATSIYDALLYLPGVTENDDRLSLAGSQSLTILINGKKSEMSYSNLISLLKSLPSQRIKSAEIMYNANPKYHTRGAAINIVMTEPGILDGLKGQVYATYQQKHYAEYFTGTSLQYATKGFNFDANYNYADIHYRTGEDIFSLHALGYQSYPIKQYDRTSAKYSTHNPWANISYKWGDGHKINLTYAGDYKTNLSNENQSVGTFTHSHLHKTANAPVAMSDLQLSYHSTSSLDMGVEFTSYNDNTTQNYRDSNTGYQSVTKQLIKRYKAYLDHSLSLSHLTLYYGAEYKYAHDNSKQMYNSGNHNDLRSSRDEHTTTGYIGLLREFNPKLSLQAYLQGEYYKIANYDKWSIFPQFNLTYTPDYSHIIQLNISSDKVYPSYWEMQNNVNQLNSYAEIQGNPSLRPYDDYSGQLSYIFKNKYILTFYVNYSDDYAVQLPYQATDKLALIFKTQNMDYRSVLGANIYLPFNIGSFMKSSITINTFNDRQKADTFHDISFDNSKWVFYSKIDNTFAISTRPNIKSELSVAYTTPNIQGPATISSLWQLNIGAKWVFLGGNADLSVKCNDVFNSWVPNIKMKYSHQDLQMNMFPDSRRFVTSFSYRFNGFKPKNNSIDTSRFGTK